jgi:Family of unknown function (DUF6491)
MKRHILFAAVVSAGLAACASTGGKNQSYADYAGAPVDEISYSNTLYNWQRTGDKTVAVWTKPSTAYLLTLKNSCDALTGQVKIQIGGIDGIGGKLRAGTDDVIVGAMHCRVTQIQPIDLQKMKQDRA